MKRMASLRLCWRFSQRFSPAQEAKHSKRVKTSDTTEPTAASAQAVASRRSQSPPEPLDTVQAAVITDSALFLAAMTQSEETTQDVDETTGKITATTNTSPHSTARILRPASSPLWNSRRRVPAGRR